jgi:hypothetical protein
LVFILVPEDMEYGEGRGEEEQTNSLSGMRAVVLNKWRGHWINERRFIRKLNRTKLHTLSTADRPETA